ncbi:MAG: hypothetical protein IPH18_09740 [Chitinophagaceae bacterium]|nr:hypothetical protein [Chitinophagaceae bacterium]
MKFDFAFDMLRWQDIYLAPVCLLLIYMLARLYVKKYQNTPIGKYVMPAVFLRVFGAFVYTWVIGYYYGFGDSHNYYQGLIDMYHAVKEDGSIFKDILLKSKVEETDKIYPYFYYDGYGFTHYYMLEPRTYNVPRLALPFGLLFSRSFLCVSFCISFLSFMGSWRVFKMFYELYPRMHKKLAYAVLFMPSVLFWGVSLLKDSFCVAAMGFFVYAAYSVLIKKKNIISSLITIYISSMVLLSLKPYILICLSAVFLLWFFMLFRQRIEDKTLRSISTLGFVALAAAAGFLISQSLASNESKEQFTSEELLKTVQAQQTTFSRNPTQGSGSNFSVGNTDSPAKMVALFPLGVVNTYFRPFPWDIRSPVMLVSFLEAFAFLAITLMCFRRIGFGKTFNMIFSDPVISFCFVFAILFGAIIGITTTNFGALVRYKIPSLSFYAVAFILVMEKSGKFSKDYIFSKKLF